MLENTNLQGKWRSIKSNSISKVEGHHPPIDDLVVGVAVGGIDLWVFARGLGQSFFKSRLESASHVIEQFFGGFLQLFNLGVLSG